MSLSLEITPAAAREQMTGERPSALIDVREPIEFATARVEPSELIPLNTLPGQLEHIRELASERPVLLLCHHGVRSMQAAMWLQAQGVKNCLSVAGGIDRWSAEVDASVPRY